MGQLTTLPQQQVEPKCSYFGTCGGCAFQDLEYAAQLELKRNSVQEALSSFSCQSAFQVYPTTPSPKPYHYRHMISLTVKRRHGVLRMGFMGRDGHGFLPVETCPIADERISQFLPQALAKLEVLPPKRRFRTSQIVLRVGDDGDIITSLRSDGGRKLECTVLGKQFSYSVSSFFQNNYSILESFVQTIRSSLRGGLKADEAISDSEIASLTSFVRNDVGGTLFDLYSGVGLFGILLADSYEHVIGIEEGYEAVQYAQQNAERNQVENILFREGKVEALLPELSLAVRKPLHVIVDPPRTGLKPEVVRSLLKLPVDRLVYVSCSLDSLVRDLKLLLKRFQIAAVQPIDLFPQTKHIETIVLLEPKDASF